MTWPGSTHFDSRCLVRLHHTKKERTRYEQGIYEGGVPEGVLDTYAVACATSDSPKGGSTCAQAGITFLPARPSVSTSATKASASASAAAATAPLLPWPGLVDRCGASGEVLAVECADCSLSFCTGRHFNKGEPLGAACITVLHHRDLLHLAMCLERFAQLLLFQVKPKVTDVNSQFLFLSCRSAAIGRQYWYIGE